MNNKGRLEGGIVQEPCEVILASNPGDRLAKYFYAPPRVGIRPGRLSPAHELYLSALSLPNAPDTSASLPEVLVSLASYFNALAHVGFPVTALCSLWTMHTWFADILPFSPPLVITGPRLEGECLLAALQAVCRNGLLILAGASVRDLKSLPIADLFPTLILPEPQLTKGMESLLSLSARPGRLLAGGVPDVYRAVRVPSLQDRFCPKAMYLGEDASRAVDIPNIVRLHLAPDPRPSEGSRPTALQLRNRLFGLRCRMWSEVEQSTFVAAGLSARTQEVANILGRAVGNDAATQHDVVELLRDQDEMMRAERASTLEAVTVEAITSLTHEDRGATELLAGKIAARVNRFLSERQETIQVSAEQIGHVLKRIGLPTVRLGSPGRGLRLDKATQVKAHWFAHSYGVLAPLVGEACDFCRAFGLNEVEGNS